MMVYEIKCVGSRPILVTLKVTRVNVSTTDLVLKIVVFNRVLKTRSDIFHNLEIQVSFELLVKKNCKLKTLLSFFSGILRYGADKL